MPIEITLPDGEVVKIDGNKVCQSASPEVCRVERPEIVELMIHEAPRLGYKIKEVAE